MVNLNIKETTEIIQSTIISDWKEDPSQTMKSVMLMSGGAGIGKTESMIQVAKDVAENLDLKFTETSTPSDDELLLQVSQQLLILRYQHRQQTKRNCIMLFLIFYLLQVRAFCLLMRWVRAIRMCRSF